MTAALNSGAFLDVGSSVFRMWLRHKLETLDPIGAVRGQPQRSFGGLRQLDRLCRDRRSSCRSPPKDNTRPPNHCRVLVDFFRQVDAKRQGLGDS